MFGWMWSRGRIPPRFVDFDVPDNTAVVALQLTGITLDGQPAAFPDYVVAGQKN